MKEAKPLNLGYIIINEFAKQFDSETHIVNIFDINSIINKMGGKISFLNAHELNDKFINIIDPGNFEIFLIKGVDKYFERLLLIQSLGHYILHSKCGKEPCYVSSPSNSESSKEGLWFSLSLLIPDDSFFEVYNKFDSKALANLFLVPQFAIDSKLKIIEKIYFNKENI
jgi:Zn-dependent peptidase ImmA (M78 family)